MGLPRLCVTPKLTIGSFSDPRSRLSPALSKAANHSTFVAASRVAGPCRDVIASSRGGTPGTSGEHEDLRIGTRGATTRAVT